MTVLRLTLWLCEKEWKGFVMFVSPAGGNERRALSKRAFRLRRINGYKLAVSGLNGSPAMDGYLFVVVLTVSEPEVGENERGYL